MNNDYFEEANDNGVRTLYKNQQYKKVPRLSVDLSMLIRNYDERSNS